MESQNEVFMQDLSKEEHPGAVFMIQLLMKEPAELPEKAQMEAVMARHLSDVECFWHNEKGAGFSANKYLAEFKDASVPPQLMIMPCSSFDAESIDLFQKSQMWNCMGERDRILEECRYQIMATDMLAATLPVQDRAELDMDFMEALVELYPQCEAVYLHTSGKLFPAREIRNHQIPREDRFIHFAVNARFFNIQGTEDMMVDTVGMSTLFLPDLQYHFHGMDPNWVVNHAYTVAAYIFKNNDALKNGDTIDGIVDGRFDPNVQWKCRCEDALIQPSRPVFDVCMGQYASGGRE